MRPDAPVRGGSSFVENLAFSIDRIPGVAGILDVFAVKATSALSPLLARNVAVVREAPGVCDLREFVAHHQGDVVAALYCEELDARILMTFGQGGIDFIADTIFGDGGRAVSTSVDGDLLVRAPSATELNLVREAALALGGALESAFQQSAHARFILEKCAPLTLQDAVSRNDIGVVTAKLILSTAFAAGSIILVVPQALLQALKHELGDRPGDTAVTDPRWSRQIEAGMARANLQVSAVLEDIEMTLADVAAFRIGHTIDLRAATSGRVQLQSAGRAIFWGHVDESDGHYRVFVDEPVVEEELWLRDESR